MENRQRKTVWLYLLALAVAGAVLFGYIFNEKIDLNGDNCVYYGNATSMVQGYGYADILHRPTTNYPPGYPLLMVPIRALTDSVVPQKILNGVFLVGGAMLLFLALLRMRLRPSLAFVASLAVLFVPRLLSFSTMMMAEASCFAFAALGIYALVRVGDFGRFWRQPWFWVSVAAMLLCYHIRTQGIVLALSALFCLLLWRHWRAAGGFALAFAAGCLPWMLRNKMMNLNQSRYLDQIMGVNLWRPEEGTLTVGGVIERFFETLRMLVTQAIPSAITPFFKVDFSVPPTATLWLVGLLMLALVVAGFWRFGRYRWLFILYIVGTLAMVSLSNTPSEDRYLVTVMPLLTVGLVTGLWSLCNALLVRAGLKRGLSPWLMLLMLVPSLAPIGELHRQNRMPFPPAYQNFFAIGSALKKSVGSETTVCSRKPELLYVYSGTRGVRYPHTSNDTLLIKDLVKQQVDYVIIEQLGYSSTPLYLLPAVQKNIELFDVAMALKQPDTYLLRFHRDKAAAKFGGD